MYKSLIKNTVLSIAVILVCWVMAFITGIIFEIAGRLPDWAFIVEFALIIWVIYKIMLKEEDENEN